MIEKKTILVVLVLIAIATVISCSMFTGLVIGDKRGIQEEGTEPEPYIEITAPETPSEPAAEEQPAEPEEPIIPQENVTNEALPGVLNFGTMHTVGGCANITFSDYFTLSNDFADNLSDGRCITIQIDDVVIDCGPYNLTSSLPTSVNTYGIYVSGARHNVTILNCSIYNYKYGIYLNGTENITVANNYLAANSFGLYADNADYCNFTDNRANSNTWGFDLNSNSDYCRLVNNTANSNSQIGFFLDNTHYTDFINNTADSNTDAGLALTVAQYNTITGNNLSNNSHGIQASATSSHNTFNSNTMTNNTNEGTLMEFDSTNNSFTNDNITSTTGWDFSTDNGTDTAATNMLMGTTYASFTMRPDSTLKVRGASAPSGGDPTGYANIGKYLNITNGTADAWIYINVSYSDSDIATITEDSLRIWKNSSGQWWNSTYVGPTAQAGIGTRLVLGADSAIQVSAGGHHTCALLNNGNITCWGYNIEGQAENYTQGDATQVSGGGHYTCALLNNGNITCWGYNSDGQSNNYTQGDAAQVSAGGYHTCALLNNGNITCWGNNFYGQSNNYTEGDATQISAGEAHTCALLDNGNITCWGHNDYGQSENYTQGDATQVSAGQEYTCALLNNGNITCWGNNDYGQSNNYTQGGATQVSAGGYHTCALLNNGNITCWGYNDNGQAENYTQGDATQVSAREIHTCALLNDGNITCWGYNADGQSNNYTQGNCDRIDYVYANITNFSSIYAPMGGLDSCNLNAEYTLTENLVCNAGMNISFNGKMNTDGYNVTVFGDTGIYGELNATEDTAINLSDGDVYVYDEGTLGSNDWTGNLYLDTAYIEDGGTLDATSGLIYVYNSIELNGTFNYNNGNMSINGVYARFASANNVRIGVAGEIPSDQLHYQNIGYYVNITNLTPGGGIGLFNITYTDEDTDNEANLSMWRYNDTDWTQDGISATGVNETDNYVWADIAQFSVFAPMEYTPIILVTNCMNLTESNSIYKLDNSLSGTQTNKRCIDIQADDLILDCDVYSLTGSHLINTIGIYASDRDNITIQNCTVNHYNYGIDLFSSSNSRLINNTAYSNAYSTSTGTGIYLSASSYNNITNNNASSNRNYGISLDSYSSSNTLTNNTANSNILYGIYLDRSSSNALTNNTAISNSNSGICTYRDSNSNTLTDNTVSLNTNYGIYLYSNSDSNTLIDNNASSNYKHGIYLYIVSDNNIINNTAISNSNSGVYLTDADSNTLTDNNASSNANYGISLESASDNNIINNTANLNTYSGIYIYSSSNSNALTNNTANSNTNSGIYLYLSSIYNTLTNNTANSNSYGIYTYSDSDHNTITSSTAIGNGEGIRLETDYNNLTSNTVSDSGNYGIRIFGSSNNVLYNNNASLNDWDFYSAYFDNDGSITYSTGNKIINLTTNNTVSSFTYSGDIYLRAATAPSGGDLGGYSNISHYLEITDGGYGSLIELNVSYLDSDIPAAIANKSAIKIWKHVTGAYDYTYQEDANATDSSGSWTDLANVSDGDWTNYGYSSSGLAYFYANYSKPAGASPDYSKWQAEDDDGTYNLSIPTDCWNQDVLQFRVTSDFDSDYVNWSCYNGGSYQDISAYGLSYAYEEAMYWAFANWTDNVGTPNAIDQTNKVVRANISNFGSIFAPMGPESSLISITGCDNLSTDNTDYVLINNITNRQVGFEWCIFINSSNITLDCGGYNITEITVPAGNSYGIYANNSDNVTIRNCSVTDYDSADIIVSNSNEFDIRDSNAINSGSGILYGDSTNSTISNVISGNSSNGIEIYNSVNITVENSASNDNTYIGITISNSSYCSLTGDTANRNPQVGILMQSAINNTVTNNTANDNSFTGFALNTVEPTIYCYGNNFTNNNATNNTAWDFQLTGSSYGNLIINLTTNNTLSSFTSVGDFGFKSATAPAGNPPGYSDIGQYLNISNDTPAWVYINISYAEATPTDESALKLQRWNGTDWNLVSGSGVNITKNYVYANISEFSIFAPMEEPLLSTFSSASVNDTNHNINAKYSINVTDADGLSYCSVEHNNTGSFANTSFTALSGTSAWCNITVLNNDSNDRVVGWYVYTNDSIGTWARSSLQTFTTTNTVPTLTSVSSNVTNITEGTAVGLTSSGADDFNADILRLECGYSNGAVDACAGTYGSGERTCTLTWSFDDNENHTLYCRLNDSYGVSTPDFELNITGYTLRFIISVQSPLNNSHHNSADLWFNMTLNKNASACLVSIDGNANTTMGNSTPTSWYNYTTGIPEDSHNVTFWCNKSYSPDENDSKTAYFTVDLTLPFVNITLPLNLATVASSTTNVHAVVNEPASACTAEFDSSSNTTMTNSSGDWNADTSLSNGNHNVKVYCSDLAGNWNASETVSFTVAIPATTGGGGGSSGLRPNITVSEIIDKLGFYVYLDNLMANVRYNFPYVWPSDLRITSMSFDKNIHNDTFVAHAKDSSTVNAPTGNVYKYFEFDSSGLTANVTGVTFEFRNTVEWLELTGTKVQNMKLYAYDGITWRELYTTVEESEGTYVLFNATDNSLYELYAIAESGAAAERTTFLQVVYTIEKYYNNEIGFTDVLSVISDYYTQNK
ncbi:MAG: NosD domain-containing protein [Candidatus Nanoarchaeia archaeon]|nr:NosD domain-containing protein [Candidatus Nanoarchaeia archaeon]MDD5239404.1 NosD domain-containing protein [Candidatus Nanoarchaeia archaeon]